MRRRGVGVGAVHIKQREAKAFGAAGEQLAAENLQHAKEVLEKFRVSLGAFARKYKKRINDDPAFRQQFQIMCGSIGVDPLASNKGFWAEMLGVGDFYYELAVQITEICMTTRAVNGGLLGFPELLKRLQSKRRRHGQAVTADDAKRAIAKLKVLGSGFQVLEVGSMSYVVSVPRELSADHSAILMLAEERCAVTEALVVDRLRWPQERVRMALNVLMQEGMAWCDDDRATGVRTYWFPSLWSGE
ncbi:unnamed protein product, partial [Phaeothamnion confervicola]